jgi:hypothetical protein
MEKSHLLHFLLHGSHFFNERKTYAIFVASKTRQHHTRLDRTLHPYSSVVKNMSFLYHRRRPNAMRNRRHTTPATNVVVPTTPEHGAESDRTHPPTSPPPAAAATTKGASSSSSRIPLVLQAVFLSSNRGQTVHEPPPQRMADRIFFGRKIRFFRSIGNYKNSRSNCKNKNSCDTSLCATTGVEASESSSSSNDDTTPTSMSSSSSSSFSSSMIGNHHSDERIRNDTCQHVSSSIFYKDIVVCSSVVPKTISNEPLKVRNVGQIDEYLHRNDTGTHKYTVLLSGPHSLSPTLKN